MALLHLHTFKIADTSFFARRFVYLGPKGSTTPLHSDVLRSHSWSANVTGRKRWRLLPPGDTHLLYDRHGRSMAPDFDLEGIDRAKASDFPWLEEARARSIELIQARDIMRVCTLPAAWWHKMYGGYGYDRVGT